MLVTPARPKVLFIINSLGGGGAERVMSRLLGLSEARCVNREVHLALLDDDTRAYPVPSWVHVHQLDSGGRLLPSALGLVRLIRKLRPAVRVSFLTRSNIVNCLSSAVTSSPCIISERTNTEVHLSTKPKTRLVQALVRLTYPRADAAIAVSRGVAEGLVTRFGVSPSLIDVIENPVDLEAIRLAGGEPDPLALDEPYIFAMGRLVHSKNFSMLVRAFAKAGLPGKLVIAGEGPERAALTQLAGELGIGNRVCLPGYLANPYATLARAQVFALSSNVEGFPNALVEALALGLPVVATNCPDGPAEIMADRDRSALRDLTETPAGVISPVDDADQFAQGLKLAFEGPARERMMAGAIRRASRFSAQGAVDRYWDVIDRFVPERARWEPCF